MNRKILKPQLLFLCLTVCLLMQIGCGKDSNNLDQDNVVLTKTSFYSGTQYFEYNDTSKYNAVYFSLNSSVYSISVGQSTNQSNLVRMISDSSNKTLFVGQQIKMPYFAYYGPYSDHGTIVSNGVIEAKSGSTVYLTITRVSNVDFDATFSGKVWSSRDPDTLYIHDGSMLHVKLPSNK